jgi:hypothetical protein
MPSYFGHTVQNFGTAIGFGGNLGGGGPVGAGRYMGVAGLNRPFTQEQYENMPGQAKYAAPALSQAAGGVTQRPSYEQYLNAWNPPPGPSPLEQEARQRQANQSRHMGQRQTQSQGDADISGLEQDLSRVDLKKLLSGGGAESAAIRQLWQKYGVLQPEEEVYPDFMQLSPNVGLEMAARGKTKIPSTDTVPAMLTPREAVLNRNAAELAGRGNIRKLNAEGNKLAKRGVDLAT